MKECVKVKLDYQALRVVIDDSTHNFKDLAIALLKRLEQRHLELLARTTHKNLDYDYASILETGIDCDDDEMIDAIMNLVERAIDGSVGK